MRILIVQTAYLGDVVLTTPLLREIRRVQTAGEVWVLTTETGRQVLGAQPEVDRFLVLDKRWNGTGVRSYGDVLRTLGGERFDVAVAPHRSVRTGVLLLLSGARLRIGFDGAPGAWSYHQRVSWDGSKDAARRYLDLARPLGGDPEAADGLPRLAVAPASHESVHALLAQQGVQPDDGLVCVAPGSVWATKRWVPEGFARVVRAIRDRGLVPVIVGTPDESHLARRVAELSGGDAVVLAGRTRVQELVALVSRARALVGNDSGPAHVAAAVGTPSVSVFGSTSPEQGYAAGGPDARVVEMSGLDCRPCGRHGHAVCPLEHFRCMRDLPAALVIDRLDEILGRSPAVPLRAELESRIQARPEVAPG